MQAHELIRKERIRQQKEEGYDPDFDCIHTDQQLLKAATTYIKAAQLEYTVDLIDVKPYISDSWPWDLTDLKVSPDPIVNLVKAAALIAAEIDRINRIRKEKECKVTH